MIVCFYSLTHILIGADNFVHIIKVQYQGMTFRRNLPMVKMQVLVSESGFLATCNEDVGCIVRKFQQIPLCTKRGVQFENRLQVHYFFVYSDHDEFFRGTKQVLDELGIENYTSDDCKIVKYVCTLVSARAAFLSSAGKYFEHFIIRMFYRLRCVIGINDNSPIHRG